MADIKTILKRVASGMAGEREANQLAEYIEALKGNRAAPAPAEPDLPMHSGYSTPYSPGM